MFCRFCGHEAPELINYCDRCGQPLRQENRPRLLGVLLIIFAVLPSLIPSADLTAFYAGKSAVYITAYTSITNFTNLFSNILFFPSMLVAIIAGCMVLKKDTDPRSVLITCSIIHIISIACYWIINLFLCLAPEVVIALYITGPETTLAFKDILQHHPEPLVYQHLFQALRMLLAVAITVLSFVAKRKTGIFVASRMQRQPFIGILLMVIILPNLSTLLLLIFTNFYGYQVASEYSIGIANYYSLFGSVRAWIFITMTILAVLITHKKMGILFGAVLGGLTLFGVVGALSADPYYKEMSGMYDVFRIAYLYNIRMAIGSAVLMMVLFFWFSNISTNTVPIWQQILCPLLIAPVFCLAERVAAYIVIEPIFPWGLAAITISTALFAMPTRKIH